EGADALGGVGGVAAIEERDIRSRFGQRHGGSLPEAATRPGDEGDPAVEAEGVEDHAEASVGAMKWVVSSPMPEMRTVTASPAASGRWGACAAASFWGVP